MVIAALVELVDYKAGGWATCDGGHVRTGLLYRSVDLSRLGS